MSNKAPILFLIFNRPDTTTRVFGAIRAARPVRLYIAADGPRPRREGEAERCADVRRIATEVDWPCDVKTLFRDENLGCGTAVSSAITWFFENEEEGIILEDDCLPDASFFPFCAELLDRYRDEKRVLTITGNNFQPDGSNYQRSYYFSRYPHIWGWATWRRAWALYDWDMAQFDSARARTILKDTSKVPGFVDYWQRVLAQVKAGLIDTWDYQLTWTCFLHRGLTATPTANLVSNIGFGAGATHTHDSSSVSAEMKTFPALIPIGESPPIAASQECDDYVSLHIYGIKRQTLARWGRVTLKRLLVSISAAGTR